MITFDFLGDVKCVLLDFYCKIDNSIKQFAIFQ